MSSLVMHLLSRCKGSATYFCCSGFSEMGLGYRVEAVCFFIRSKQLLLILNGQNCMAVFTSIPIEKYKKTPPIIYVLSIAVVLTL